MAASTSVNMDSTPALGARLRDLSFWAEWTALVGLVALLVIFGIASPSFLTPGNIAAVLVAAAIPATLCIGEAFVVLGKGIDLSMASTMTLGAVMMGQATLLGVDAGWACLLTLVVTTLVGGLNGLFVAKVKITDFVVTLGMLSAAQGAALIISDGKPVTLISPLLLTISTGQLAGIGYPVLIALAIAVVAHVTLFHTRFGTHVLAVGGDIEAARAMGINTDRIKIATYMISGFLAGVGAILIVARLGAAEPAADTKYLLDAVASVVLGGVSLFGGRGSIAGPVTGAVLLTVLVNGLTLLSVEQYYQPLVVGIVVIAAAALMRYQR